MSELCDAAEAGDFGRVKLLVGQGAEINLTGTFGNTDGVTALAIAAWCNRLDIVRYLVEHGADVDHADAGGGTPLIDAVSQGHLEVARYLLEQGADSDTDDDDGWTSLHYAAFYDHLEIAKLLMVYGADLNTMNNASEMPIDVAYNEAIVQAIHDEPERRRDQQPRKRCIEEDRHPNAVPSASAEQDEEDEGKLAEEVEPSEPSDEEDGNDN